MLQRQPSTTADITDPHNSDPLSITTPPPPGAVSTTSGRDDPPVGPPITPYRLFNIALLLGLGIPKAVFTAKGQSVIAGDLDWAGGVVAVFMYIQPRY